MYKCGTAVHIEYAQTQNENQRKKNKGSKGSIKNQPPYTPILSAYIIYYKYIKSDYYWEKPSLSFKIAIPKAKKPFPKRSL